MNILLTGGAGYIGSHTAGIEHDLCQAGTVPHVDKNHATMIAPAVHPAKQRDGLAQVVKTNLACVAGTHEKVLQKIWQKLIG